MSANNTQRYWEFEKSKRVVGLSIKKYPEKPCWEMASDVGDFRSAFNICADCIVFLLRNGTSLLSEEQICSLGDREVMCKFLNT